MSNLTRLQGPLFILSLCLTILCACHHNLTENIKRNNRIGKVSGIRETRKRIKNDTAIKMAQCNEYFPLLWDSQWRTVKGFQFKPDDFAVLSGLNANSLFFSIGIKNFWDSAAISDGDVVPEYTLIVIPLNKDMTQMQDANGPVAFDFVCPCPGASCCPKQ
jgi:hypothetical protein